MKKVSSIWWQLNNWSCHYSNIIANVTYKISLGWWTVECNASKILITTVLDFLLNLVLYYYIGKKRFKYILNLFEPSLLVK